MRIDVDVTPGVDDAVAVLVRTVAESAATIAPTTNTRADWPIHLSFLNRITAPLLVISI